MDFGGLWAGVKATERRFGHHFRQVGGKRSPSRVKSGTLRGFGLYSMGGGYTRKPVVYWSDDDGKSWHGPQLLHGPMHPGTDTACGDLTPGDGGLNVEFFLGVASHLLTGRPRPIPGPSIRPANITGMWAQFRDTISVRRLTQRIGYRNGYRTHGRGRHG